MVTRPVRREQRQSQPDLALSQAPFLTCYSLSPRPPDSVSPPRTTPAGSCRQPGEPPGRGAAALAQSRMLTMRIRGQGSLWPELPPASDTQGMGLNRGEGRAGAVRNLHLRSSDPRLLPGTLPLPICAVWPQSTKPYPARSMLTKNKTAPVSNPGLIRPSWQYLPNATGVRHDRR